ncbi:hypothetical protein EVAR_38638_1 [Eumeta japonica]|uniref:Uncharacterized protein n=1 Tax=Eumeta variegata TaxID=151549 RepID=A0A4C1Y0S9_EUMVA|nr:hypothetical protein EVAR_38638_1 [Eumeta japonica]
MKDASGCFFDIASRHPNPLLVLAVSYEPPPPHNFCRRPRNVLLDPLDDLTVEVEKLIEVHKIIVGPRAGGRAELAPLPRRGAGARGYTKRADPENQSRAPVTVFLK